MKPPLTHIGTLLTAFGILSQNACTHVSELTSSSVSDRLPGDTPVLDDKLLQEFHKRLRDDFDHLFRTNDEFHHGKKLRLQKFDDERGRSLKLVFLEDTMTISIDTHAGEVHFFRNPDFCIRRARWHDLQVFQEQVNFAREIYERICEEEKARFERSRTAGVAQ